MKIIPLLATANGNLAGKEEMILAAAKRAEEYVFPKLGVDWGVNVLFTDRMFEIIIPEDGVGGRTYTNDLIVFGLNEQATEEAIFEMLCHELCHAARWGKNDEWIKCLFDGMINEGIATYFEAELMKEKTEKTFFIKTIEGRTDAENEQILEELRGILDKAKYDYNEIFYHGNEKLPRWAGYSVGFYLVKKYLAERGKTIEEAFTDKYEDFRMVLKKPQ